MTITLIWRNLECGGPSVAALRRLPVVVHNSTRPHTPGLNNLVNRDLLVGKIAVNDADLATNKDDPSPTVGIAIEPASLVQRPVKFQGETGA